MHLTETVFTSDLLSSSKILNVVNGLRVRFLFSLSIEIALFSTITLFSF